MTKNQNENSTCNSVDYKQPNENPIGSSNFEARTKNFSSPKYFPAASFTNVWNVFRCVCVCAVRAHKIVLNENEKMENSLGTLNFII